MYIYICLFAHGAGDDGGANTGHVAVELLRDVYIYIIYAYTCIRISIHTYIYIYQCIYIYVYSRTEPATMAVRTRGMSESSWYVIYNIYMHIYVYVNLYIYIYISMCIYIYLFAHGAGDDGCANAWHVAVELVRDGGDDVMEDQSKDQYWYGLRQEQQ